MHTLTNNKGSGYDLACTIYGGIIKYNAKTLKVTPIKASLPINLVYCGYKTKTPLVIERINTNIAKNPEYYQRLFTKMGTIVKKAQASMSMNDYHSLGQLMHQNHALLEQLGAADATLNAIYDILKHKTSVFGAKISGAGLGDCIVTLGDVNPKWFEDKADQGIQVIDIKVSHKGLIHDDN